MSKTTQSSYNAPVIKHGTDVKVYACKNGSCNGKAMIQSLSDNQVMIVSSKKAA